MDGKRRLRDIVIRRSWEELDSLRVRPKKLLRRLMPMLYDAEALARGRAAEAIGRVVKRACAEDPKWAREFVLRLFWSLNEESGSVGWGAPLALGEIAAHCPDLMRPFHPCVIAMLAAEGDPMGALQAAGRIGEFAADLRNEAIQRVSALTHHGDADVRACAAWALGRMRAIDAREPLADLLSDSAPGSVFDNGEFRRATVADFAAEALKLLDASGLPSSRS